MSHDDKHGEHSPDNPARIADYRARYEKLIREAKPDASDQLISAFLDEMEGKEYGYSPLLNAFAWFWEGWAKSSGARSATQPAWIEEELKDGDRICEAAGVQRTEGGRLPVAKIVSALKPSSSIERIDAGTLKAALVWGLHKGSVDAGDFGRVAIHGAFDLNTAAEYLSGKLSATRRISGDEMALWLKAWWLNPDVWRAEMRQEFGPDIAQLMRGVADMIEEPWAKNAKADGGGAHG